MKENIPRVIETILSEKSIESLLCRVDRRVDEINFKSLKNLPEYEQLKNALSEYRGAVVKLFETEYAKRNSTDSA